MQTEELKILLALETAWTVSINGREFLALRPPDICIEGSIVRFGPYSRKIMEVQWLRPNVVRIRGRSRFRAQVDTLTFYPGQILPPGIEAQRRRRSFQRQIGPALADYYGTSETRHPMKQILHSDKQHGVGGAYPRFMLGSRAIITVDPDESAPVVNGIMRAAIMWSSVLQHRISIVVPEYRRDTIAMRLRALPAMQTLFEWLQWDGETIAPLDLDTGSPGTQVHEFRLPDVAVEVDRIRALAPGLLQPFFHISAGAISLRLRGLEVARVTEWGTTYPMGEPLEQIIDVLARERQHGSRHPLARAHEESWLESNLTYQVRKLLPVRPEHIYPQVPSYSTEERRIIDLLTITEEGRLVVIEVKAAADPDLPFQAFDYWLAVEQHRKAGDFEAKGYFQGLIIRDEPALLVIVAPLFVFHKTLDRMASMLPKTLPLVEIGLGQSWKRDIHILRRKGAVG